VIQGQNGQGKSNLLEAIYMLSIAKSLRSNSDKTILRRDLEDKGGYMQVGGLFIDDAASLKAQLDWAFLGASDANKKTMSVTKALHLNGAKLPPSDFIGKIKMVLFEVGDVSIIFGSPNDRRRYMDILITQTERAYLKNLQRYKRIVHNRNRLLSKLKLKQANAAELEYWNEQFALEGGLVVERRLETLMSLQSKAETIYEQIGGRGKLKIGYGSGLSYGRAKPQAVIERALGRTRAREIAIGHSLIGPHRDDLRIFVDRMPARDLSRGEARLVTLALKIAEADQIAEVSGKKPIVALDDAFSELDFVRRERLLELLEKHEQILLTSAEVADNPTDAPNIAVSHWIADGKLTRYDAAEPSRSAEAAD